jgi:hypothetical protein
MKSDSPFVIVSAVFVSFALLAEVIVLYYFIYRIKSFSAGTTYLIYVLHASSFLQNVASIPNLFTLNDGLCSFMGFFHYYFGLINIAAVTYLSYIYYQYSTSDSMEINVGRKSLRNMEYAVVFSFITLLPLSTDSYGATTEDTWCSIKYDEEYSLLWAWLSYYIWAFIAAIISSILFGITIYRNRKYRTGLAPRLFTTLGIYILISILYILPRALQRLASGFQGFHASKIQELVIHLPLNLAGIAYAVIFFYDRRTIKIFERRTNSTTVSVTATEMQFSLEDLESVMKSILDEEAGRPSVIARGEVGNAAPIRITRLSRTIQTVRNSVRKSIRKSKTSGEVVEKIEESEERVGAKSSKEKKKSFTLGNMVVDEAADEAVEMSGFKSTNNRDHGFSFVTSPLQPKGNDHDEDAEV